MARRKEFPARRDLPLQLFALQPFLLPIRIISVVNGELRELNGPLFQVCVITFTEITDKYFDGPTITDDVVLTNSKHVVVIADTEEMDPDKRCFLQVEDATRLSLGVLTSLIQRIGKMAEINHVEGNLTFFENDLLGLSILLNEGGT